LASVAMVVTGLLPNITGNSTFYGAMDVQGRLAFSRAIENSKRFGDKVTNYITTSGKVVDDSMKSVLEALKLGIVSRGEAIAAFPELAEIEWDEDVPLDRGNTPPPLLDPGPADDFYTIVKAPPEAGPRITVYRDCNVHGSVLFDSDAVLGQPNAWKYPYNFLPGVTADNLFDWRPKEGGWNGTVYRNFFRMAQNGRVSHLIASGSLFNGPYSLVQRSLSYEGGTFIERKVGD